jgi:tripartite-type tricarboxylate transporter receptor subunit TctC
MRLPTLSTTRRAAFALPLIAATLGLSLAAGSAMAADPPAAAAFPTKIFNVIVPYPAGGASDFVARLIQPELQKQLGQQMLVDNVGGVSGALGIQKMLAAPADGYNQVLATPMELVLAPLALNAVKFKSDDLRLAGVISYTSVVMLARKDLPVSNLDEFFAWAKGKEPTYGSVGIGSLYHLQGEKLAQAAGLKMTHIPYKGGGPLITDLGGGQVDIAFFPLAGPVPGMIKDGKVKVLGITQATPHPMFPDVPPMSRHKLLADFNFDLWIGLQVPKATPDAVVARLNAAMNEVVKNADVKKGIEGTGGVMSKPMTPAELDKFYTSEIARYRAVAKSIKLEPQ